MGKLMGYLKQSRWAVLVIVLLLVVQAYCDLSLPAYTSDIVDVGIQQSGIEWGVPTTIRPQTLAAIEAGLTPDGAATLQKAYRQEGGVLTLVDTSQENMKQLEQLIWDPVVELATRATGAVVPADMEGQVISQFVMAEYQAQGVDLGKMQMDYLLKTGGKMLLFSLVMVVTAVLVGLLASRVAARIGLTLRGKVFKKVIAFSSGEVDQFSTASLITRSTNDIQQVQMVMVMLLRLVIYAPILGVGGVLKVLTTQTQMGWVIGLAVAAIMAIVAVLMVVAMPKFKKMQVLVDKLNLVSREILTGLPVIRAFSREKHEEERFEHANNDLMQTQLFTNRVMSMMMPTLMLLMNGLSVLIVWVGSHGVDMGTMQVGDMIAFINYTMIIVMSFLMIAMVAVMLPRAVVAAGRINEILDTTISVRDKETVKDGQLTAPRGLLEFHDVSFRYPDADADVLEHISFVAKPGETTAIIGSTGSGKSSLLNLIPRFFDVSYGKITIDGIDIRDLSQHKLRSLLGYVPQKGVLFSGSIRSNLKFGGADIGDDVMETAAQVAQAEDFIATKEMGYDDPIAQGGTNVSGGQKQRLSIARAVAKNPKIFLFDDSFSALDYKTDVALRRALGAHTDDSTVIIVAQRVSTILHAQQIVVLEEGKVVGVGNHQQLMGTCPTYEEIARSQLSAKELGGEGA